jgi:two-component system cell cycle sensor histidine kinase/response regulator CckA
VTQPLQILVVEDDPDTLAAVATLLRDEDGFAVWVARSGEQALEVADELGFNADLIVVDLHLGPGMRGDQFVAAYRRRSRGPFRLIVLSGVPAAYEIARTIRASAVISKPYEADELVRTIRILAANGGASQDAAG